MRFHRYYSYGCVATTAAALLLIWLSAAGIISPDAGRGDLGRLVAAVVGMGIFGFPVLRLLIMLWWSLGSGPHPGKFAQVSLLALPLLSLIIYGLIMYLGG